MRIMIPRNTMQYCIALYVVHESKNAFALRKTNVVYEAKNRGTTLTGDANFNEKLRQYTYTL